MNTAWLLAAQYEGRAVIPIEIVARDYFPHLDAPKLARKINEGLIALPMLRSDPHSMKSARGVHVLDLAAWIDRQAEAARKECRQLTGSDPLSGPFEMDAIGRIRQKRTRRPRARYHHETPL
jgi:hypothetical protein